MTRVLAVIGASAALLLWIFGNVSTNVASAPADWTPIAGMPLKEPAQIYRNRAGVLHVTLTASAKTIMVSGAPLGASPFGDSLNGPTLHVRPGDTIKVTFVNKLGQGKPTNIHYHGLHVSPLGKGDNVFRTFDDGRTYRSEVKLPANHPRGTYWYHVHLHGDTDEQVMGGLSGLLIVEGLQRLLPKRWSAIADRQLALRDVQTSAGSIVGESDINPNAPSTRLVNALYQPKFSMKSNRYELWRLANIGSDVFYDIRFTKHTFAVIAEDGLPVWRVTRRSKLLLPPGKRFDVLVLGGRPGTYQLQSLPYAQHANGSLVPVPVPTTTENLATVTVKASSGPIAPAGGVPKRLVPKHDLSKAIVAARPPPFVFAYTGPPFAAVINGVSFTHDMTPAVSPVLNTVEEWTLQNSTTDDHPFHIHVNDFQVMSVNGKPYHATGLQDVVTIPKQYKDSSGAIVNGEVVIRQRYTDFTGWFVYHCHILQHEDLGMMATIQVRAHKDDPITPPPDPAASQTG